MDSNEQKIDENEKLIRRILQLYKDRVNISSGPDLVHDIYFDVSLKPTNYFFPDIRIGGIGPPFRDRYSLFAEVWVNKRCIYRISEMVPDNHGEDITDIRLRLTTHIIQEMLLYGLNSARRAIEEYEKEKAKGN